MRLFKSLVGAALALSLIAAPAAAMQLWSQQIGDVNFPGLSPNENIVTSTTPNIQVVGGETSITATATAATGLTTLLGCTLSVKIGTAPGVTTSVATYTSSGGTLNLFAWQPTSNANPTLIAATTPGTVGWVCVGQ